MVFDVWLGIFQLKLNEIVGLVVETYGLEEDGLDVD